MVEVVVLVVVGMAMGVMWSGKGETEEAAGEPGVLQGEVEGVVRG